jgi:hypothetical protein
MKLTSTSGGILRLRRFHLYQRYLQTADTSLLHILSTVFFSFRHGCIGGYSLGSIYLVSPSTFAFSANLYSDDDMLGVWWTSHNHTRYDLNMAGVRVVLFLISATPIRSILDAFGGVFRIQSSI